VIPCVAREVGYAEEGATLIANSLEREEGGIDAVRSKEDAVEDGIGVNPCKFEKCPVPITGAEGALFGI
jgi:hypothetical protein